VYDFIVYAVFEADDDEEEVEFEPDFKTPPTAPPDGEVEVVAFSARRANFSKVFPEVGALIAPTIPAWQ
jgi:hypothetical protein